MGWPTLTLLPHTLLAYLAELGMARHDDRVARAVERYISLQAPDRPNLNRWEIPPDYRNHQACLYVYNLRTFVMLGYGQRPALDEAWALLERNNDGQGRYILDGHPTAISWNPGPKGQANKWVTLYAYLAFKHAALSGQLGTGKDPLEQAHAPDEAQ